MKNLMVPGVEGGFTGHLPDASKHIFNAGHAV
jgi:hypothetical protein